MSTVIKHQCNDNQKPIMTAANQDSAFKKTTNHDSVIKKTTNHNRVNNTASQVQISMEKKSCSLK